MKNTLKLILQKLLGFPAYLFLFSRFKIATLRHDRQERDFFYFMSLLSEPIRILDIGANIGIMSCHLGRRFPEAEIIAFEPIPDNFRVLERILTFYKLRNVQPRQLALGEQAGKVKMVLPRQGKTRMQGLSHVRHESITEWNEGEDYEVNCVTLDGWIGSRRVDAIKLDVENFEYFVLSGGRQLLQRDHPLIYVELWENENRSKCFALLKEIGYNITVVEDGKLSAFDPERHRQQNFICVAETIR